MQIDKGNNIKNIELEQLNDKVNKFEKEAEFYRTQLQYYFQALILQEKDNHNLLLKLDKKKIEAEKLYVGVLSTQQEKAELEKSFEHKQKEAEEMYQAVLFHEKEKEKQMQKLKDFEQSESELITQISGLNEQLNLLNEKTQQVMVQIHDVNSNGYPYLKKTILNESLKILSILSYKNFSVMCKIYAVLSKLRHESFSNGVKLVLKLLLRCVGIKKHLYIEEYRPEFTIRNSINAIMYTMPDILIKTPDIKVLTPRSAVKIGSRFTTAVQRDLFEKELVIARNPKVSVLMPIYNHAKYIWNAISSVQNQTYDNWELIILDDGSTDNLHEVLSGFKDDSRIRMYCGLNQGLPNALTSLHQLATGEFITWTSADNVMLPTMLMELAQALVQDLSAASVFADVAIIDDAGQYVTQGYRDMNKDRNNPSVMRFPHSDVYLGEEQDNFINACFMYRAEVSEAMDGQYGADLTGLEDYDFWLRLKAFGKIKHIKNVEPLYLYRVHENTLSQELLTTKREEHIKRGNMLMKFSKQREQYVHSTPTIFCNDKASMVKDFKNNLAQLSYTITSNQSSSDIQYTDDTLLKDIGNNVVAITQDQEKYQIYVKQNNHLKKRLDILKGHDISPIARKARYTTILGHYWEYPEKFMSREILGCHLDLRLIDLEKTKEFLNCNKQILFVFCALPKTGDGVVVRELALYDNVVYIGEYEAGIHYQRIASWDGVFVPPLQKPNYHTYLQNALIGWSAGKWILYEAQDSNFGLSLLSYAYCYKENLLGIKRVNRIAEIEDLLDSYIDYYSTKATMTRLIHYAHAIGQDVHVPRPCFNKEYKLSKPVQKLGFAHAELLSIQDGYIGLMVETLDKGGLEQVVAFLARQFKQHQIDIRVLCTKQGGEIARQLQAEGFVVKEFHADGVALKNYLTHHRPLAINSHYVNDMLDIPAQLNIPIVPVIHNMYVAWSEDSWKAERKNAEFATKMIAVSQLVKDVYLRKHGSLEDSKIAVVENAACTNRLTGNNCAFMRDLLGIGQDSMVFLNVSSFDSRKNQIGLITAFEHFYNTVSKDSYLVLMGNTLSEFYKKVIDDYVVGLQCKEHLLILDYHADVASIIRLADVFVMSSYFEGWSIAATEALYCGLPLIHTKCGSGIELIKDGENGILIENPADDIASLSVDELFAIITQPSPPNTGELLDAMTKMYKEREQWHQKRPSIASISRMEFCQSSVIQGYCRVLSEVIRGN